MTILIEPMDLMLSPLLVHNEINNVTKRFLSTELINIIIFFRAFA